MPLKIPNVGELAILNDFLDVDTLNLPLVMRLYKNDHVPADGDVLADYTECDFDGYAEQNIVNWAFASTISGRAKSVADILEWTKAAGVTANNVYGYYVVDGSVPEKLLWAERDPEAPILMSTTGKKYSVQPVMTTVTEF